MDIKHLLDFKPPAYFCPKCYGLLRDAPTPKEFDDDRAQHCPVCRVEFTPTPHYGSWQIADWLRHEDYITGLEGDGLVEHAKNLATIARSMEGSGRGRRTPLRALYAALSTARCFVHFITYSFDSTMVGTFRAVSSRVPVRGVLGNVPNSWVAAEIDADKLRDECPQMHVRMGSFHQKLVVIDGLLALTGSANVTMNAYRSAAKEPPGDEVRAVTSVAEVIDLNNRLFSPAWANCGALEGAIEMSKASAPFCYRFGEPPPRDPFSPVFDR